jgi:hypothetical protein
MFSRQVAAGLCAVAWVSGCSVLSNLDDLEGGDAGGKGGSGGVAGAAGDASTVDAQGCWTDQKVCDGVCTSTKLVDKGCAGESCTPCALPHATAKCSESDGLCAVDTCEPGWENCDKNTSVGNATGCEAQIAVDPKACGASCTDCTKNGPNWSCCNGQCVRDDCIANGQLNCDCAGECDVAIDDINNCGFCNHKCEFAHATALCEPDSDPLKATNGYACHFQCTKPWADCDGLEANGCEVDLSSDTAHCGSCSKVCNGNHGTAGCSAGKCIIICDAGWGDCDSNADNGCETPLNQMGNCGGCGVVCAPQHASGATCASGSCTYGSCDGGWGDCNNNKADGCETSLATLTNCGSCGKACAPQHATGATCSTGSCNYGACDTDFGDCNSSKADGCETPLGTNQNCSGCNYACASGKSCQGPPGNHACY